MVHEEPPPISRFLSWETTAIQSVLDRGLAKRWEDRFESVGAFASALAAAAGSAMGQGARSAIVPALDGAAAPPVPRLRSPRGDADLPRDIDRVPHGPERALALGLAVLGLAAVIFHAGWYEGFPRRAVDLEHELAGQVKRQWRARMPSAPEPAVASAPQMSASATRNR